MANYYTVVQYVPDPVKSERINVGVVAFSESEVKARFVSDWKRAKRFGGQKIDFLKTFANEIHQLTQRPYLPEIVEEGTVNEDRIREMVTSWNHCIQFTDPHALLKDIDHIIRLMGDRFLVEPEKEASQRRRPRDRRKAAQIATQGIRTAVQETIGARGERYVKRKLSLPGHLEDHEVDVGIRNGRPLLGAEGFSFEAQETTRLERQFESYFYRLEDVRNSNPDLPLAMVALPPDDSSGAPNLFGRAKYLCGKVNIGFVVEDEFGEWARDATEDIKHYLHQEEEEFE